MLNTRTNSLQQGQVIVMVALLLLVLFGMLGLAVDSGRAYVDRRDQQAAVDAAALAAGDWYENYLDLNGSTIPNSVQIYETDLHLYSGYASSSHTTTLIGPNANLPQDTYTYSFSQAYSLTVVATNTQFNGYEFQFTTTHNLPLAFMQIFGGSPTVSISATATSIVGNQRQTPALLTLSTQACATQLQGAGMLTILGDAYTNGTACVDANLHLAGNCYGATGSNCGVAQYYCYNSSPGFIPYPSPCAAGDTQGGPVVPAPSLPDPGYLAPSVPYYPSAGQSYNRGNYTEMTPGTWNSFSISGGGCYFLDPGVYTWNGGYTSHGGMVSNELKAPHEELYSAAGSTSSVNSGSTPNAFYGSSGCEGDFTLAVVPAPSNGLKHQGGAGWWGVELTSVRYDQFLDPTVSPNPCFALPGCKRESTPSGCEQVNTLDISNSGIAVAITANAPGARYYFVYLNPNGCDGIRDNFSFVGSFNAPGWTGGPPGTAAGPPWIGTLSNGSGGWPCPVVAVTICNIAYNSIQTTNTCVPSARAQLCRAPDDELDPQCFASCPPAAGVPASNNKMKLEYPPNTGGDVANENYCVVPPNPGDVTAPCSTAKITPGAVQFYFPSGACLDQNGNGSTHVFGGEQYNWIVIYQVPANNCSYQKLNGNALTQYIGTMYSPAASWDILGSDTSPLAGQVIAYAAKVTGSANAGIDFNPNYTPAPPAARLIN